MMKGCQKYFQTSIASELDISAIEEYVIIIIGISMCLLMCRHISVGTVHTTNGSDT